jgi:3-hydroxyisobutyrate dehydrogenase-like beta-hydroxyacid dehydrogenase
MSHTDSETIAIMGLGIIGSRAHANLVSSGRKVTCWNRTKKGLQGEAAAPSEAIAGVGVISLYLKDAPAVRGVMETIADVLVKGQVVLNHSTIDLQTTLWLDELCVSRGCHFLDAPFTGSKLAAGKGDLVYYIGGEESLAAELEPLLSVTSRARIHCGPVGAATVVKLATNLISACTVQAMAEALAIATRHGVSGQCLADAVAQNASGSALTAMKFPAMLNADFETHFSLSNMGKDSRYMLDLASSAGLVTPAIDAVSKRMEELCDAGLGESDYSVLAQPYLSDPES